MAPELHFKSAEGYRKNMAYRHIHDISDTADKVVVAGKEHKVKHSTDPKRMKIDAVQRKKESKPTTQREKNVARKRSYP
jgi:uncharacterized membrane protein